MLLQKPIWFKIHNEPFPCMKIENNAQYIPQGLPSVSTPLKTSNLQGTQNSDPPKVALGNLSRQQWNAKALINRSKKGRLIWEAYQITSILSRKDRIFITHLIIDEFVDEFGRLTREELACRATELKNIFPTVEQVIFIGTISLYFFVNINPIAIF